jgi:hypothetical protein
MDAHEVIEAYVTEVALQVPRRQRNDVALELRELIAEGLRDRAEAAGRPADAEMAIELLNGIGHPARVAARYRPTLEIVDPADGRAFVRASAIGLVLIWGLGLWSQLREPVGSGWDLLHALGQWWGRTVIPSLWWPGVLVVGYGLAAWARRRRPDSSTWRPRSPDFLPGTRAALVLGILGIACSLYVLVEPRWLLDSFWDGRAAPAAYEALTYTDTFRQRQGPWLLALLLLYIPLLVAVVVKGRWGPLLRRLETGWSVALYAAMLWVVLDGPVFLAAHSDRTAKFLLVLIGAATLLSTAVAAWRRVRPAPN